MAKTIVVTGSSGQLGQELQQLADQWPAYQFIFTDRQMLDISDEAVVMAFFESHQPNFCINCAAYTAVDKAETEQEKAFWVNEKATAFLAKACRQEGTKFIHISSDYVYHNQLNRPLRETDPCTPKGIYAKSKLAGEQLVQAIAPETIIIRTSWVYSSFGHNFVKTMLRLGNEHDRLKVVYDQIGAPTYAHDLAKVLLQIIDQGGTTPGIFNFANSGISSWFDFAKAIFEKQKISCQVNAIPSSGYPTPAPRPSYSVLDCRKIQEIYGIEIPYWRDSLSACLAKM